MFHYPHQHHKKTAIGALYVLIMSTDTDRITILLIFKLSII